jgi:hypothetical protein
MLSPSLPRAYSGNPGEIRLDLEDANRIRSAAYTAELKVLEPRFEIKPIAIQATLDEIAKTDPRAKQIKAQQLIDRRFLEEMQKDGTFERLGLAR